jgi:hypothetical protein
MFLTLRGEYGCSVFLNRVLRRMFGPKRAKVAGGWRNLPNKELHNLYGLPNIFRMIKSRKMRWMEHVVRMEKIGNAYKILVGKCERKISLEDIDVDGRIILE